MGSWCRPCEKEGQYIRTDHNSLRWLMRAKNPEGQLARWIDTLSSFHFEVQHRPDRKHSNADSLSHVPCRQCSYKEKTSENGYVVAAAQTKHYADLNLTDTQAKDNRVGKRLGKSNKKPLWKEISKYSARVKSYWSQFDRLVVENGLLSRLWYKQGKPVVPSMIRTTILQHCHDQKTAGHFGVRKTLTRVRNRYYWVGLQSDVRQWVKSCEICPRRKAPQKTKSAPMQTVGAGHPMERVATDKMGPLTENEFGNKYILVISDYFTKWVEAIVIPD